MNGGGTDLSPLAPRAANLAGAAIKAVTRYWPIVAVIGIVNVVMNTVPVRDVLSPEMALPALVVITCISIVAHGKVAACSYLESSPTVTEILRDHSFNFLVVVVIVGIPGLVVRSLERGSMPSSAASISVEVVVHLVTDVLTLYALPLVFYRRVNVSAILLGVKFLIEQVSLSRWLIALVVIVDVGMGAGVAVLRVADGSWPLALSWILVVLGAFGSMVVFAGAVETISRQGEKT